MDGFVNAIPSRCFRCARQRAMALMDNAHGAEDHAHPTRFLYGLPILVKDAQAVSGYNGVKAFPATEFPKEAIP